MPKDVRRRHFMGISRSGQLLEDRRAFEVDEEVIVEGHKMAFDDDRVVPYYELRQEGIPPLLMGYVQLYTGGSRRVTDDDWWLTVKAKAFYDAAARSITESKGLGMFSGRKMGVYVLSAGIAVFLFCVILIGYGMKLDAQAELLRQQGQAAVVEGEGGAGGPPIQSGELPGDGPVVQEEQR